MARIPATTRTGSRQASRVWPSSKVIHQQILDSARDLFSEQGYQDTSISEIVTRSGVSVGSIYHHIGGKAEIFNEIARVISLENARASRDAVANARDAGVSDEVKLFLAGARAYLLNNWTHRDFSRTLIGNNQPVSYVDQQKEISSRLMRGARGLVVGAPPTPDTSSRVILALLRECADEIARTDDAKQAELLADYYIGVVRTLARSR
ncbi:TetR/AcrR family transcriptional regulator [Microbacterium sp. A94]|uniref:TetR/AcrR family transcriptional regulator n=1 Tax=Microbacterium sp. A94 TaxID=3450717 RepID=UPI003F432564